jgi:transposase-like protein
MKCYKCESTLTVKNGHDRNGTQKYFCKCCKSTLLETKFRMNISRQNQAPVEKIKKELMKGKFVKEISTTSNLSVSTVYRVLRTINAA